MIPPCTQRVLDASSPWGADALRTLHIAGYGIIEEIGVADFVPQSLSSGGIFSTPQFEAFSSVVERASSWCAQQISLRFCNAQSIEIKLKSGRAIVDTQRTCYTGETKKISRDFSINFSSRASGKFICVIKLTHQGFQNTLKGALSSFGYFELLTLRHRDLRLRWTAFHRHVAL